MPAEVHLELLVGRLVRDVNGRRVGRIEEVHAELREGELLVMEFVVGMRGLLERMALTMSSIFIEIGARGVNVPWNVLDLSDPDSPRLRCPLDELQKGS